MTTTLRSEIKRRTRDVTTARILTSPFLSVVIPTLNAERQIGDVVRRLHETMRRSEIIYEAIIVDDHSTDATVAVARRVAAELDAPVRVLLKRGRPGKTYSLIEGLDAARYEALATLDGDLRYPPEALPDLLSALERADLVVGDRRALEGTVGVARWWPPHPFNAVVGRGPLAFDTDLKSGMRVFRRAVYQAACERTRPWGFDLELLACAREQGLRIANARVRAAAVYQAEARQLNIRAARQRKTASTPMTSMASTKPDASGANLPTQDAQDAQVRRYERWLLHETHDAELARSRGERERYALTASQAVIQGRRRFLPFAPHNPAHSSMATFTRGQLITIGLLFVTWLAALIAFGLTTLTMTMGVITALYLFDLGVTMFISMRTLQKRAAPPFDNLLVRRIRDEYWPSYTILCPLYHEAEVAAQFVDAIRLLDYPSDRLQVLFLTEEDDSETRRTLLRMNLPEYFDVVVVPEGKPRTKPRACNYGLLRATGDFVVIYDAEDIPDPLQLKKAVLTFAHHGADLACVQASLNFYNPTQNLLTRWFTSEYSLWFDLTLPALQRMKSFLPLGGTSNHFRARVLREVGGWDPFNVTEDCDLGVRLAQYHYRTAMVDSTTYEEANPDLGNWLRQRSRWVKGYMQTYLTHMRNPWRYVTEGRLSELFWLQVIVGGKPLAQLINPLLWLMLAVYLVFHQWVTPLYHLLYPAPVFYAAAVCLVFGNFFYVYSYLIGCLNRRQYLLTLWSLFIPVYWLLMSVASYIALFQLLTRPYYWEKTKHGLLILRDLRQTARHPWPAWLAAAPRAALEMRWSYALRSGLGRFGLWMLQPALALPMARSAFEYVSHEVAMVRRDVSRGNQQHAWLAPSLALPVAPVVDMLSTTALPAIAVASVAPGTTSERSRETRYIPALHSKKDPVVSTQLAQPSERVARGLPGWLRDRWLIATLITSIVSSVSAFLYYYNRGETLLYGDAEAHLRLARMPFAAVTPGLTQLGSVWLPLPHILMWPFIWNTYLWDTAMAGSFTAMICYVVTGVFIYKTARLLSGHGAAAYIGTLAYLLNPNILYLQTTPLSELALLATMSVTCYTFLVWARTGEVWHLLVTAFCAFLATLTRYEGWSLFFALIALIVVIEAFKRSNAQRIVGEVLLFATPGVFSIALWVLWNYLMTGDALFFQNGPYSAGYDQLGFVTSGQLPTLHNLPMDFITYGADLLEFAGPLMIIFAVIGLIVYLVKSWWRPEGVAALALLAPVALYVVSLYGGQISIFVPGVSENIVRHNLYNVRYGATSVLPLAVFVSTLLDSRRLLRLLTIGLIVAQSTLTSVGGVITQQDGLYGLSCLSITDGNIFLAEHYNGGRMLADVAGHLPLFSLLQIPLSNAIYDGSYQLWSHALADPARYVDWVIVTPNDVVSTHLNVNSPQFKSQFVLVMHDSSGEEIFYKRGLPPLPDRPAPTQLIQRYAQCNPQSSAMGAQTAAAQSALASSLIPADARQRDDQEARQ